MSETQEQDTPQEVANEVVTPAPETTPDAPAVAPAEEKQQERLVESALEAKHSDALPLSPIETSAPVNAESENKNTNKHQGRRGLRRGNSGRGNRGGKNAAQGVGIVENPQDVKETLSGKFVDGYQKDKEFRPRREKAKPEVAAKSNDAVSAEPQAKGWCPPEAQEASRRRHPQSNTNANRGKLIIEPAPIPVQEKDPSIWQKFKAKILAIFGLDKKKKKHDKKRHGGKYRNKHGKKFQGKGGEFRKGDRNGKQEFRGGNRRNRHNRGPRPGNSGARPHQNSGGNTPAA